ncbi:unnamed protein product [Echinostoma caproni]|uniref:Palmitoyltransferase n=1 Tax=Echinostoma caproni TaxID=27848 RepID=A0A3P8G8Q7_9TREM|nr:unnamed protein product [Echinostoma caproni]
MPRKLGLRSKLSWLASSTSFTLAIAPGLEEYKSQVARLKQLLSRLCHTCNCLKPLRTKHCAHCDRCVEVFDHHCPITNNYKFFKVIVQYSTKQQQRHRVVASKLMVLYKHSRRKTGKK